MVGEKLMGKDTPSHHFVERIEDNFHQDIQRLGGDSDRLRSKYQLTPTVSV
jgi:hypothetical protein